MKDLLLRPYALDLIKIVILVATLKVLNLYYNPGNTIGLFIFLAVVIIVKLVFTKKNLQYLLGKKDV